MGSAIIFFAIYTIVIMAFVVINYIFTSIAIMTMLKKCGHKSPFLAWVPFASIYVYGELASKYEDEKPQKNIGKSLLTFNILLSASSSLLGAALSFTLFVRMPAMITGLLAIIAYITLIVFTVIYLIKFILATWRILRIFAPSASVGLLMLCIFVSAAQPFILFAIRNNEPQNLRGKKEEGFTMPIFNPYMYQSYPQMGMQYPNNIPQNNPYVAPPQNNNQNNNQNNQ